MKKLILAAFILSASAAFGSDHWDNCASADGYFKLEGSEVVSPSSDENVQYAVKNVLKTITIKQEKETCNLQKYKTKVVSFEETTTFEVINIEQGTELVAVEFLCKRGGSGIPANDECNEATAKSSEVYKVKQLK